MSAHVMYSLDRGRYKEDQYVVFCLVFCNPFTVYVIEEKEIRVGGNIPVRNNSTTKCRTLEEGLLQGPPVWTGLPPPVPDARQVVGPAPGGPRQTQEDPHGGFIKKKYPPVCPQHHSYDWAMQA